LLATNERLLLRIEARDSELLGRIQEVVTRHFKQVASTEVFEVSWSSPGE
jgi:hypothetical protein